MFELPKKLNSFKPYEPLTGEYKIRLDVNESFIKPDEKMIAEAMKNISLNRYPDPYATATVKAFAKLFGVKPEHVTAGNGADELIGLIIASLLEKGDRTAVLVPDFPMYAFYSQLHEIEVVEIPKNETMTVDIDEAVRFVNENNIKALMFSNPCNPTSLGIKKADITRLITGTKALVVLDEAYMDFWSEAESLLPNIADYENLIVLRTCSKSCSLAGIRLGFAVANEKITRALRTMKPPFNVGILAQAIGTAALSDASGYKRNVEMVKKATKRLYNELTKLAMFERIYVPCTNFVFIKTARARGIYEELLDMGIAVRCFDNHLRICAGTEEETDALIKTLQEFN